MEALLERREMDEELLDELYEALTKLCHYYEGMRREIAQDKYTSEQAERDWTALTCNEGMNILSVLADMAFFQKAEKS